jgi:hypothetical protein
MNKQQQQHDAPLTTSALLNELIEVGSTTGKG